MRHLPLVILFMLALASGPGCSAVETMLSRVGGAVQDKSSKLGQQRWVEDPMWFDAPGPHSVDIESFGGDVTIIADPGLEYATVQVTRRALHGATRKDEAEASLASIGYDMDIKAGPIGPVLALRTYTNDPEPHFQRLDVEIMLPEIDGVRVDTVRGNVNLRGVSGAIDISARGGRVRLATPRPMTYPVTIVNHSGPIDYRVRGESTGRFDCESLRGLVTHHVRHGEFIVSTPTDHDTLSAVLNDGDNPVILRAADGDVRIAVVSDPVASTRSTPVE